MNSLICISSVPDTTTKIVFDAAGKGLNKSGVQFVINPYDEFALVRALEFKEKLNVGKVVVLSVGEADVDQVLRKALAIGADEAVRIDAAPRDARFVAEQIAAYAKDKNFDLIMGGKESIDFNGAEVMGMVAALLDLPFISFATSLEINGRTAEIRREVDGGTEILECPLPLVLGAQKGMAEWRMPNMRGIMAARTKPLAVVKPVEAKAYTESVKFEQPPAKAGCKYIDPKNVHEIVKVLQEKGVI
ncbi:MAG: electron transfer flavoprotein subunit beta/FixA family protein [Bacteroidia bacterium]|nr:electron transfer flavoprotein subunit beta/FixA family protein [Bacteroidia bacterium]MDW8333368.1 electron transfer flavoprotein subunit beta/FixA family protein [Bacteroidia bacterium]